MRADEGNSGKVPRDAVQSRHLHPLHAHVNRDLGIFAHYDSRVEKDNHSVFFSALVNWPIAGIVELLKRGFQFTQATKPCRMELVHEFQGAGIVKVEAAESNQPVRSIVDQGLRGSEI